MDLFLTFVSLFCGITIAFSVLMLVRNERVHRERGRILSEISLLAQEDIDNSRPWEWRYERFERVSYDEMLHKFWKPVCSFFTHPSEWTQA